MFRSKEQEQIYDIVKSANGITFINGDAGLGKTRAFLSGLFNRKGRTLVALPTLHLINQMLESDDMAVTVGDKKVVTFVSKASAGSDEEYLLQKDAILEADMVICTHAMLIRDLLLKGIILNSSTFNAILVDEADKIPQAASLQTDGVITNETLEELDAKSPSDVAEKISALRKKGKLSDELRFAEYLVKQMLSSPYAEVGMTSKGLELKNRNPARILRYFEFVGTPLIMVSGTLAIDEDFTFFERAVGLYNATKHVISIDDFGKMDFVLAERIAEDKLFEYQIEATRKACEESVNTLVLTTSYDMANRIYDEVGGTVQQKGEKFIDLLERYEGGILITPNGWEGYDTNYTFSSIVIPRIPFAPPEELLDIPYLSKVQMALRKLHQGMLRGLRHHEDYVKIWLLDPRFPFPASVITKSDRTQGHKALRMMELQKAIPKRFRNIRFLGYQSASVFEGV